MKTRTFKQGSWELEISGDRVWLGNEKAEEEMYFSRDELEELVKLFNKFSRLDAKPTKSSRIN